MYENTTIFMKKHTEKSKKPESNEILKKIDDNSVFLILIHILVRTNNTVYIQLISNKKLLECKLIQWRLSIYP